MKIIGRFRLVSIFRLPYEMTLATEIIDWEERLNAAQAKIHWSFSVDDARQVFKEHYPTTLVS